VFIVKCLAIKPSRERRCKGDARNKTHHFQGDNVKVKIHCTVMNGMTVQFAPA